LDREKLNVPASSIILVESSEDETGILRDLLWCNRSDTVDGVCGLSVEGHKYDFTFKIIVGDDDFSSEDAIIRAASDCQRGTYLRLMMLNPLFEGMPSATIVMQCTCNRFDHTHVREQWIQVEKMCNDILLPNVGFVLIGFSSDGDARRFKLQAQDTLSTESKSTVNYKLDCDMISHGSMKTMRVDNNAYCYPFTLRLVHSQDPIHKSKLLYAACAHQTRILMIGTYVVTHADVCQTYWEHEPSDRHHLHDITAEDVKCEDRQNFRTIVRMTSRNTLAAMRCLKNQSLSGTIAVLQMISTYMLIFFGTKNSVPDRIKSIW
jgi:hypothetical protein